jgi:hypothetical protein
MAALLYGFPLAIRNGNVRKERVYKEVKGVEDYTEGGLRARYRFGREALGFIVDVLRTDLERPTKRGHALSPETQVLIALRFFASGSFQQVIGDTIGVDKSTVSNVVRDVSLALVSRTDQFIKWPNAARRQEIQTEFFTRGGFPLVIGAVDGTHVRIQGPSENEPNYVNRKNYHSINVQAVCDDKGEYKH